MKAEKLYLVGFCGKNQTALYSNRAWSLEDGSGGVEKMTLHQAKRELKSLQEGVPKAIFKVVPYKLPLQARQKGK